MINDGPDGHCDGSNVIAEYVYSLLNNNDKEWEKEYFKNKYRIFTKII